MSIVNSDVAEEPVSEIKYLFRWYGNLKKTICDIASVQDAYPNTVIFAQMRIGYAPCIVCS